MAAQTQQTDTILPTATTLYRSDFNPGVDYELISWIGEDVTLKPLGGGDEVTHNGSFVWASPTVPSQAPAEAAPALETQQYTGTVHYLTWPTAETYLCGADAVGRRNTARDTDHWNTSCVKCMDHPGHPFEQDRRIEANDR